MHVFIVKIVLRGAAPEHMSYFPGEILGVGGQCLSGLSSRKSCAFLKQLVILVLSTSKSWV